MTTGKNSDSKTISAEQCALGQLTLKNELIKEIDDRFDNLHSKLDQFQKQNNEKLDKFQKENNENRMNVSLMEETIKTINISMKNIDSFVKEAKGNGKPGIWENIRVIDKKIKIIITVMILLIILQFGGNMYSVRQSDIDAAVRESLMGYKTVIPQPVQKNIIDENCNLYKDIK